MCAESPDPPNPPDLLQRQRALLQKLSGRGVAQASEYFARQAAESSAPAKGSADRATLDRLFPEAERLEAECGGRCRRVRSEASLCGRPSAQGYQCPVEPYGGPPRPEELAALTGDARWAEVDPGKILYLDTETTGLALGAGTYTFLIGLGWFDGERFVVEQYFMEDYDGEGAIVEAVDRAFAGAQGIVSYNGRTFDVPLLETRWMLQRRRLRLPELHLDLLHYARRLWRLRLPNCSLSTVENQILDITRMSDVDGSWVPRIYFDFTRGIRPERIVPVFDHHAQDIYSLGALAAAVLRAFSHPEDERFAHAGDQWGLARLYEARGRIEEALARMESAVLAARDEEFAFRLAMHLAKTYKRLGRAEEAVAIWEARVAQAAPGRLDPLIELAKHAEHALRDFALARQWAERALTLVQGHVEIKWLMSTNTSGDDSSDSCTEQILALTRRMDRLETRKKRADEKSQKPKRGRRKKSTDFQSE